MSRADAAFRDAAVPRLDKPASRPGVRTAGSGPVLLVLHGGDPRLTALVGALAELGYAVAGAASDEEARAQMDRAGSPDVLLAPLGGAVPPTEGSATMPAPVFARECLARYPALRVLYLTPLPWPAALPLVARERLLRIPFTAATLAATLLALGLPAAPPPHYAG